MRFILILALFCLCSCENYLLEKINIDNQEKTIDEWAPNICETKFLTYFDNMAIQYTPMKKGLEYALQTNTDNVSSPKSFLAHRDLCVAIQKVVTPYVFSERRGMAKNDLSLKIIMGQPNSLKPGMKLELFPTQIELLMKHQLVYAGNEKNTNVLL